MDTTIMWQRLFFLTIKITISCYQWGDLAASPVQDALCLRFALILGNNP